MKVYQSDGTPAPVAKIAEVAEDVQSEKNATLPLLTEPLAMGGQLPANLSGRS